MKKIYDSTLIRKVVENYDKESIEKLKEKLYIDYSFNKHLKNIGDICKCPICHNTFIKKTRAQVFCGNKNDRSCKDAFWNFIKYGNINHCKTVFKDYFKSKSYNDYLKEIGREDLISKECTIDKDYIENTNNKIKYDEFFI